MTEGGGGRISNTSILPNTKEYLTEHRAKIRIIKLQKKAGILLATDDFESVTNSSTAALYSALKDAVRKKNGIMWEKFPTRLRRLYGKIAEVIWFQSGN